MKKFGGILVGLSLLSLPLVSMAQTTTSANVQALLEQIKTLQAQLDALKQAQTNLKSAKSAVASTTALIRNLRQGMSGDDVTALQAILAADPSIYPEGIISGYFGTLTAKALKKFQERNGLEGVGFVGPRTLKLLNGEFEKHGLRFEVGSTTARRIDDNNDSDDDHKVLCVPPGQLIAPGLQKKEGENRGKGKGGENFIQASTTNSVLPICRDLPGGIQKKIDDDWWKHLPAVTPTPTPSVTPTVTPTPTATPTPTPTVTPTPDTTAPVISAVSTLNLMGTTTSIVWSTDEASNSKIWFGTTSPITTSGDATKTDSGMVTNHVLNLSDLATSTTYFYVVGSTDSSGNIATSSQASFLTATGL